MAEEIELLTELAVLAGNEYSAVNLPNTQILSVSANFGVESRVRQLRQFPRMPSGKPVLDERQEKDTKPKASTLS
jgi:hypothetical protein